MRAEYRALFVSVLFLRMRRQAWSLECGACLRIAGLLRLAHMAPNGTQLVASSFSLLIGTPWLLLLIVLMIGCDVDLLI